MKATLGGVTLPGDQELAWTFSRGTVPHIRSFEVETSAAIQLEATMGRPIKLHVQHAGGGDDLNISHLYVISSGPARSATDGKAGRRRIEVADRRIWWGGGLVTGSYNVRRFTGNKDLIGERVEVAVTKPEIKYAPFSLKGEVGIWTAKEVLEDVFKQLGDTDPSASAGYTIRDKLPEVEIEDLQIDDGFGDALGRIPPVMPGIAFFIDSAGRIVVENKRLSLPSEGGTRVRGTVAPGPLGVELWSSRTFSRKGNRAALRPSSIRVHFTREVEVKWEFDEAGSQARDAFSLQNVLPSPDPELTIGGESVGQSSWVLLDDALTAWSADTTHPWPATPSNRFPITQATLRKHFMQRLAAESHYIHELAVSNPDPIVLARLAALLGHWRSTMRINSYWWGRLESVSATRAAIVDRGTGQRAPAPVYGNHVVRPSFRGVVNAQKNRAGKPMMWAVTSYSGDISTAKLAPARVRVIDKDAGIVHWELRNDPWGWAESITWGAPKNTDELPHQSIAEFNRRGVQALALLRFAELVEGHKAATILTVVPATPNTKARLHAETVTPAEAQAVMGGAVVGPAKGPPMDIRILPSVMGARYAWTDANGDTIHSALKNGGPIPADLLTNDEHVRNVAVAAAAAVYEGMLDLTEAPSVDVTMTPGLTPRGPIERVTHGMLSTSFGAATISRAELPRISTPGKIWKFLPPATRKEALRIREGV